MEPSRKTPAHGVHDQPNQLTVVLVTINTEKRQPWLAADEPHALLRSIWAEARAWLVGYYMLMPEHTHFFATRGEMDCSLENWISYWEREFKLAHGKAHWRFQSNHWDTRMRNGKHYEERYQYVRNNPVRRNLVEKPEDWPYQGVLFDWVWMGK